MGRGGDKIVKKGVVLVDQSAACFPIVADRMKSTDRVKVSKLRGGGARQCDAKAFCLLEARNCGDGRCAKYASMTGSA